MFYRIFVATCLTLLLTSSAWAAIQPGTFTLSPMVGGHLFDDDQNLDESLFWSVGLGYNLTERAALEAVFSQTTTESKTTTNSDINIRTYRLDALYHFMPEQRLVPYFAVGFGGIVADPDNGSNSEHLLANIGGGIKYFLNEAVALRADVRYLIDFPEPNNNLLYSAGLLFQFGTPDAAPAEIVMEQPVVAAPVVASNDNDNDGVLNELDQCPGSPAGSQVNSIGCPLDTDGDGVLNKLDQCPDSPAGAQVNNIGCPLDTDGDGVIDLRDNCPDTPKNVSIDTVGCPTKLTLQINFGLDSDNIGSAYDAEISKAAQCINDYPGNVVYIDGHTDNLGPAAYNQKLSERRAAAVMKRLNEKFAIPVSRMTSRGFGESTPVADNASEAGLFLNRRVEVACGSSK